MPLDERLRGLLTTRAHPAEGRSGGDASAGTREGGGACFHLARLLEQQHRSFASYEWGAS